MNELGLSILTVIAVIVIVTLVVLAAVGGGHPEESDYDRQMRMHRAAQYTKRRR